MRLHNVSNKEVRVCWCVSRCAGGVSTVSAVADYKQEARVYAWENINDTAAHTEQSAAAHTGHYSGDTAAVATVTTCQGRAEYPPCRYLYLPSADNVCVHTLVIVIVVAMVLTVPGEEVLLRSRYVNCK